MATRILVVEDNNNTLAQLVAMLQAEGFEIVTATDGEQGWSVIQQTPPHAIVSGVRMPNLDGIGLLRRVRNHAMTLPVVLIAAESSSDTESDAHALGVTAVVYMPIQSASDLTRWLPTDSASAT